MPISSTPESAAENQFQDVQVLVEDIDEVYETDRKNVAKITEEITALPWGIRRDTVVAEDRYIAVVSQTDDGQRSDQIMKKAYL